MSDWAPPACGLLERGLADPVTLACLGLAVGLVGAVAAGFVAFRTALHARSPVAPIGDGGLVDLWRLWRQRERTTPVGCALVCAAPTSGDRTRGARSTGAAA